MVLCINAWVFLFLPLFAFRSHMTWQTTRKSHDTRSLTVSSLWPNTYPFFHRYKISTACYKTRWRITNVWYDNLNIPFIRNRSNTENSNDKRILKKQISRIIQDRRITYRSLIMKLKNKERTGHSLVSLLVARNRKEGIRAKGLVRADPQEAKRDRTREYTQAPAACNKRALNQRVWSKAIEIMAKTN